MCFILTTHNACVCNQSSYHVATAVTFLVCNWHIFFLSYFSSMIARTFFLTFLFLFFLQMLYVDNLQHGLNTNPFSLPRCAFLDTSTIDSIANMDRMRDVSSETVEFGKLMVRTHTLLAHIPLLFLVLFSAFFFCNSIEGKVVICVHTSLQFVTHPFTSWLTFILFFTKKIFAAEELA